MNVHRNVQVLGGFEDRPEFGIIQIFAARMAVDDGALEPQLANPAFQFLGRAGRILWRDRCQTSEPIGMLSNRIGQLVVEFAGQRGGLGSIKHLHARRGQQKDLHRDTGVIHIAQAPIAQVLDAFRERCRSRRSSRVKSPKTAKSGIVVAVFEQFAIARDQFRRRECFFGGDASIVSHQASLTNLVTKHASKPSMPSSLPWPLSLIPPNGESRTEIM